MMAGEMNGANWDGEGGLRYTGIGRIDPIRDEYSPADVDRWMEALGQPQMLPEEKTYKEWAERTAEERGVGRLAMKQGSTEESRTDG